MSTEIEDDTQQDEHKELVTILKKKHKSQQNIDFLDENVGKLKWFADFKAKIDKETYSRLLRSLNYEKVNGNQCVFRKKDIGDKLYIILKGTIAVMIEKPEKDVAKNNLFSMIKQYKMFNEYNKDQNSNVKQTTVSFNELFLDDVKELNKNKGQPEFLSRAEQQNSYNEIITQYAEDRFQVLPPIKISRPVLKLCHFITRCWHDLQKTDVKSRKEIRLPNLIFQKFNGTFYTNLLLKKVNSHMDIAMVLRLFPKWKDVQHLPAGAMFGEIALIQKCTRSATIYCLEDCEFATIVKKGDSDFDYQINYEQNQTDNFQRSFDVFNWWTKRNKLGELFHGMKKDTNKKIGDYIFKAGDTANTIVLLMKGEVEITLKNSSIMDGSKKFSKQKNILNDIKESKEKVFKRILHPNNIFGQEELFCDIPKRMFTAKVKSVDCVLFHLDYNKINQDMMVKNPSFIGMLLKYSTLVHEPLSSFLEKDTYRFLRLRAFYTLKKYKLDEGLLEENVDIYYEEFLEKLISAGERKSQERFKDYQNTNVCPITTKHSWDNQIASKISQDTITVHQANKLMKELLSLKSNKTKLTTFDPKTVKHMNDVSKEKLQTFQFKANSKKKDDEMLVKLKHLKETKVEKYNEMIALPFKDANFAKESLVDYRTNLKNFFGVFTAKNKRENKPNQLDNRQEDFILSGFKKDYKLNENMVRSQTFEPSSTFSKKQTLPDIEPDVSRKKKCFKQSNISRNSSFPTHFSTINDTEQDSFDMKQSKNFKKDAFKKSVVQINSMFRTKNLSISDTLPHEHNQTIEPISNFRNKRPTNLKDITTTDVNMTSTAFTKNPIKCFQPSTPQTEMFLKTNEKNYPSFSKNKTPQLEKTANLNMKSQLKMLTKLKMNKHFSFDLQATMNPDKSKKYNQNLNLSREKYLTNDPLVIPLNTFLTEPYMYNKSSKNNSQNASTFKLAHSQELIPENLNSSVYNSDSKPISSNKFYLSSNLKNHTKHNRNKGSNVDSISKFSTKDFKSTEEYKIPKELNSYVLNENV